MTWDTNILQKKMPNKEALLSFFDRVADECVFRYEKGIQKKKDHIQGTFTMIGSRQSKTRVLRLFETTFKNVAGLAVSSVYDKVVIKAYVVKTEGGTKGPFYGGKEEVYDKKMSAVKLYKWQKELERQ